MQHEEFKYVDVAIGGPERRGNVMDYAEAVALIKKGEANTDPPKPPCYISLHRFDESFKAHVDKTKSVSGYSGPSYTPWLVFDFDDPELALAHTRAQQFIGEIINGYEAPKDEIVVYFSGRKGYHAYLPAQFFGDWRPSETLHKKIRALAERLGGEYNIDTSIYDKTRLLRHPMTTHPDTGLYKRWVPTADFMSATVEEVQEMAVTPGNLEGVIPPHKCSLVPRLEAVWLDIRNEVKSSTSASAPVDRQSLEGSFPVDLKEGDGRDNQVYWKAKQLRDWGVPAYEALNILRLWDSAMEAPLTQTNGPNILWEKIRSAYGADAEFDPDEGIQVYSGREALNEYQDYLDNPGAQIATGYEEIDRMHRYIRSGEVVILLGKTGSGKTAFALNLLRNMAMGSHRTLFFSLEMTLPRVIERQCAIEAGVSADDIEGNFQDHVRKLGELPWWDNYHITAQSNMSMPQIEQCIQRTSDYSGKVDVVCIDYLGLIKSQSNNNAVSSYQAVSEIAASLKAVSKRCECAIIVLAQISRAHGEEGDVPISISSARDSGVIEEGADLVLGVHRPELGQKDRTMAVQILKSRKGSIHAAGQQLTYAWNGPSFTVQPGAIDVLSMPPDAASFIRQQEPSPARDERVAEVQETLKILDAEVVK